MKQNTLYAQAFAYMANGYSVIPIGENKRPLIQWKKYQKERADESQIEKWWKKYPNAGVGIVTGKISKVTVIDIDVKNDKKTDPGVFPKTRTIRTPSGGYHLYYKYSDTIGTGADQYSKYPHTDIRNDGGYVVAPPTEGYVMENTTELAEFPSEMFPTKKRKKTNDLLDVKTGARNESITTMIGKILATTQKERWNEDAWPVVVAVNKTYSPPLSDDELKRTFQSIASKETQSRNESIESPIQLSNTDAIKYQLRKSKNGAPHKDITNAVYALQASEKYGGKIRYEKFSGVITINGRQKADKDTLEIQRFLQNDIELSSIPRNTVEDAIEAVGFDNEYDAAIEYLESLTWDGVPRVDTWLTSVYGVEEDEYTRSVGSNWLRALVNRIVHPGGHFDHVLVIEGEQGVRKSTSFEVLGGGWHLETIVEAQSKDFLMQFQGKAIIELSEGDTLTRSEVKSLKAIITRTHDKYRAPYGRHDEEHPRRCVFCMTTNDDAYLKDDSGNRRWWPVRMPRGVEANIEWLRENRDQLFSEAYQRMDEPTWKVPRERVEQEQEERRMTSEMEEDVVDWYVSLPDHRREEGVTTKNFMEEYLYKDNLHRMPVNDRLLEMQIGGMYRSALKLEKKQKRISDERRVKRYFPTEKTPKNDPKLAENLKKDDFEDW